MEGVALAVAAAVAFGLIDFGVAIASRRLGTPITLAAMLGSGIAILLPISIATGQLPDLGTEWLIKFAAFGGCAAIAYLALVQALRLGPLSVVGPITSSLGAATAVLAIIFVGDRPTVLQGVAIIAAGVGAVLTSVVPGGGARSLRLAGPGALFAGLNVLSAAVLVLSLRDLTQVHWAGPVFVVRAVALLWLGGAAAAANIRPDLRRFRNDRRLVGALLLVCLLGAADGLAMGGLALSFRTAPAWLVGIITAISPAIVTLGGLVVLRERVRRTQAVGLALLAGSLALLSFSAAS